MEGEIVPDSCLAGANDQTPISDDEPIKKSNTDMAAPISSGCFDCNICFEFAVEPVVTLCGHLYCWPCIYEWLRPAVDSAAAMLQAAASPQRQCPVCKATLSPDTLVPLYGRGGSSKKQHNSSSIPCRPTRHREAVEYQNAQGESNDWNDHNDHNANAQMPLQPIRQLRHSNAAEFDYIYPPSPLGRGLIHSTAVAVLPWAFRGQLPPASMFYSSPYYVAGHPVSPRLRRQQMEVERSLHQIWFFLFVFAALCLLLF